MDPYLIAGNSYGSNVLIDIPPVGEKYSRFEKNYVLDIRFDEYLLNLRDVRFRDSRRYLVLLYI